MAERPRSDSTAPFGIPLRKIVEARDAFSAAWKNGSRPSIESFVQSVADHERARLLQELISLELDLRRAGGETPRAEEYYQRFPGDGATIGLFFGQAIDWTKVGSADGFSENQTFAPAAFFQSEAQLDAGRSFGDYELHDLLGRGGMGEVYRARQKSAGRIVALKVIRPDYLPGSTSTGHGQLIKRFQAEAHAAAQLEHENIVAVYEVGEHSGRSYYAMRYIEGTNLADSVSARPLPARKAAELLEPVARGVAYAHAKGILHRDIKPRNILLDGAGKPYIADFGLAKEIREASELTKSGEVLGTPSYIAPEQARDSATVGPPADIYSLGATLYHLIAGRPPFQASEPVETLRQVLTEEPLPPRRLNPALDRDIETICLKCLEKEPNRRYATADLLADDLRRYLEHQTILARPLGRLGRTWRWCRRNRLVAALLVGLIGTLLATAAVSTTLFIQTKAALQLATQAEANERGMRELATQEAAKAAAGFNKAYMTGNKFLFDFDYSIYNSETLRDMPEVRELRRRLLTDAVANYRQILADRPDDEQFMADLAETYVRLADVHAQLGSNDESLRDFRAAIQLRETLFERQPTNPRYRRELALVLLNRAEMEESQRQWNEALASADNSRRLFAELVGDPVARAWAPENKLQPHQLEADLLEASEVYCRIAMAAGKSDDAKAALERAIADAKVAVAKYPINIGFRKAEAGLLRRLGELLRNAGDAPAANRLFGAASANWMDLLAMAEKRAAGRPGDLSFINLHVCAPYREVARLQELLGDYKSAEQWSLKSRDRLKPLANDHPRNAAIRSSLGDSYNSLQSALCLQSKWDEAEAVAREHHAWARTTRSGTESFKAAMEYARLATELGNRRARTPRERDLRAVCERAALEALSDAGANGFNLAAANFKEPEFLGIVQSPEFRALLDRQRKPKK